MLDSGFPTARRNKYLFAGFRCYLVICRPSSVVRHLFLLSVGTAALDMIVYASPVCAEMWTNAAGHAIEAKVVGGDGQNAILERPNGMRVTIPILSLAPAARSKVAAQLEGISPGISKKALPKSSDYAANHARTLYNAGQISAEELNATLGSIHPARGSGSGTSKTTSLPRPQ